MPSYLGWGCDEPTKRHLERFGYVNVTYAKETHPLATTAYSDLYWMDEVKNRMEKELVAGFIECGDADSGYQCEGCFRRGQMLKRRVRSGEFPENFWEETKYVNIPVND